MVVVLPPARGGAQREQRLRDMSHVEHTPLNRNAHTAAVAGSFCEQRDCGRGVHLPQDARGAPYVLAAAKVRVFFEPLDVMSKVSTTPLSASETVNVPAD